MAMYQHRTEEQNGLLNKNLYLSERNIYGSSRIGQEQIVEIIASSDLNLVNINTKTQNSIGDKYYEMSNHLGNVLAVVSDRKLRNVSAGGYYGAPTIQGDGINVNGGNITSTISGWGEAGGTSVETLNNGDYMEWTLGSPISINYDLLCGLSFKSRITNWDDDFINYIDFRWYLNGGVSDIVESSFIVSPTQGGINIGDVFKIMRDNGNIKYLINNTVIRTTPDPQPNDPMIVHFIFLDDIGKQIQNLKIYKQVEDTSLVADVVSYSDYYPYGMQMPGRNGNTSEYAYSFQGQEHDNEIKGKGNSINYKYRMHDTRLGRFFAIDPLASKYPYYSPYAFSGNRVIDAVEEEGLQPRIVNLGRLQISIRGHNKGTGHAHIGIKLTDNYKSPKSKNAEKADEIPYRPVCKKITSIWISDNVKTLDDYSQPISPEIRDGSRERVYSSENSIDIKINTYSLSEKIEIIDEKTGETLFIDEEAINETLYRTKPGQSVRVRITGSSGYEINVTTIQRTKEETVKVVDDKKKTLQRERTKSTPENSEASGYERTEEPCSCDEDLGDD